MAPTLAAVAALPSLRLLLRSDASLDVPVRWVAVSELTDPTPFLEGGELVLTTGMRLDDADTYVARLVGRAVAGLGFGVGLGHDRVPESLVGAARRHGLPLLEVPRPTPFVAIGKAVSRMLAAEQYEDVTRAAKAQRELARAALRGPDAVLAVLARVLRGWALLLDPAGEVSHAAPDSARARAAEVAVELPRLASAASLALPGPIVVQPVGLGRRPRAYLAVGTPDQLRPVAHTVVGAAVSLLSLRSETSEHRVREALGGLLLGTPPGFPEEPVRVLLCGPDTADALEGDPAADRCLTVPHGALTAVIAPDAIADRIAALAVAAGPVGVGDPVPLTGAVRSLGQAERARPGEGVRRHSDLPGGVLGQLGDPAREAAAQLLTPLDPVLRASLHAYLAHHGQGDPAARALGIHRHTLRHRMRRAADLLDRDLDDPTARAELWIALTLTDGPTPP